VTAVDCDGPFQAVIDVAGDLELMARVQGIQGHRDDEYATDSVRYDSCSNRALSRACGRDLKLNVICLSQALVNNV
jgi:hypothetical protein